jgi:UDP-N-acetylmuramoyl-tripeptide--D-alanyl-D-alanine ligase
MTDVLWTVADLTAAAQGVLDGAVQAPITGFSIDTRSIHAGDVFVALQDVRDGHHFVSAAFKAGAAAALVRHDYERQDSDGALIWVDDPLRALERIGVAARARLSADAVVIAVTGSAGKTGAKEMLRACLAPHGKTHAPEKSFNNHWGVPLTLARMPVDTRYAVIEIGMNHAGEITPLTKMTRPHIAVITNVLPVHVGNFPDGEIGVAHAKAEIFEGLVEGGVGILPRDNTHYDRLRDAAARRQARVVSFGTDARSEIRSVEIDVDAQHTDVAIAFACRRERFRLGAPGRHLAVNALAVAAVLDHLKFKLDTALVPLAGVTAPAGRGARATLRLAAGGEVLLVDESYNANPASMAAALANLALVPRAAHPRRIAVMGDMRELGAEADALHRGLLDAVLGSGADLVFACGPHMKQLYDLLPADKQAGWAATSTDIAAKVAGVLRHGDVVMIKGSLGSNMAPIVSAVRVLDAGARTDKA